MTAFALLSLAILIALGGIRGAMLYRRGIRVLVIDRQRSVAAGLVDLGVLVGLALWGYELVAHAWPLERHLLPAGPVVLEAPPWKLLGCAVMASALALYAWALRAFGTSWRMGIDREAPGPLVTDGPFGWSRNPIYLSLLLVVTGSFLLDGHLVFAVIAALLGGLFRDIVRREEIFLRERFGAEYRAYTDRVERWVTFRRSA